MLEQLLTYAFTPVIQPVLKQYARDVKKIEHIHRNFTFKLSLLGAAADVTMFLLIAIPVQIVLSTSGSFFQTVKRHDLLFISWFLSATVMVASIIWGITQHDMIARAWALVATFHINLFQAYFVMYSRIFKANLLKFFARIFPSGALILIVIWFFQS